MSCDVGPRCSSDLTPSLGPSICCRCGPKKQKGEKKKKEEGRDRGVKEGGVEIKRIPKYFLKRIQISEYRVALSLTALKYVTLADDLGENSFSFDY